MNEPSENPESHHVQGFQSSAVAMNVHGEMLARACLEWMRPRASLVVLDDLVADLVFQCVKSLQSSRVADEIITCPQRRLGYVGTVGRRLLSRRKRVPEVVVEFVPEAPTSADEPCSALERKEYYDLLKACIAGAEDRLKPRDRLVMDLLKGGTRKSQIANDLRVGKPQISRNVQRVRAAIEQELASRRLLGAFGIKAQANLLSDSVNQVPVGN